MSDVKFMLELLWPGVRIVLLLILASGSISIAVMALLACYNKATRN